MPRQREFVPLSDEDDEDLVTPEYLMHLPPRGFFGFERADAGEVGAAVARKAVAFFREPENLAGISGAILLQMAVFRGKNAPFLAHFLVALAGDRLGVMAYRSYRNLEIIAQAAQPPGPVPAPADDA